MKTIISIILYLITLSTICGQAVDSVGCTGAVGDVKYSILDSVEFINENGNCWVLLDGRQITGSKLHTLISRTTIPDARGYFIRSYDNRQTNRVDSDRVFGSLIGDVQQDEFKSHSHNLPNITTGGNLSFVGSSSIYVSLNNQSITTSSTGGSETRPKNITMYTYIRIN